MTASAATCPPVGGNTFQSIKDSSVYLNLVRKGLTMVRQSSFLLVVIAFSIIASNLPAQESNENFDETEFSDDHFSEFDSLNTDSDTISQTERIENIEPIKNNTTQRTCVGLNFGGQLFNGDVEWTKAGWSEAVEIFFKFPLKQRFSVTPALGYGSLSDGSFHIDKNYFFTEMITFDLRLGINLINMGSKFNSYLYLGAGIISFKLTEFNYVDYAAPSLKDSKTATSTFLGVGFEYQPQPNFGLSIQGDYRFTNSDHLEGINSQAADGYANIRIGFNYYFKSRENDLDIKVLAEPGPVPLDIIEDDTDTSNEETSFFEQGLNEVEETEKTDSQVDEFMKLKSRLAELNDLIRQKEVEIYELKAQLEYRNKKLVSLKQGFQVNYGETQQQYIETDMSDFADSYEEGLRQFYSRNYDQSIYIFSQLLEVQPNHRLASNCQYWIGECYFGLQNYANALDSFKNIFSFEHSAKIDDALIMMARCLIYQGEAESARGILEQLLDEFPDSEYIAIAEKYLNQL